MPEIAAIEVRSVTIAVASLTRLSPSRIVMTRRGRPTRRAIAVAATASGGATTAPSAKPTASLTSSIAQTTRPTPTVVNSTSPTLSSAIGRRYVWKSINDVRIDAAYSSGGSRPISTISGVSSKSGTKSR